MKNIQDSVDLLTDDVKQKYGSTRNWVAVLYPENMIPDWQNKIYRLLQVPFCYVIHDQDDIEEFDDRVVVVDYDESGHQIVGSDHVLLDNAGKRKTHVHLMIHYGNTTTYSSALDLFKSLSALGKRCCNTCQPVRSLEMMWHYFIHNTEDCLKLGKFVYDSSCRICGNNWDLGAFIQLEHQASSNLLIKIDQYIKNHNLMTYSDVTQAAITGKFDSWFKREDAPVTPFDFVKNNRPYIVEICKGNYFKLQMKKEQDSSKK